MKQNKIIVQKKGSNKMKNIFDVITKEDALTYCYLHENEFKAAAFARGEDGVEQFDCLISIIESGTIQPNELPKYGMDFETKYADEEPKQLTTIDANSIRKICKEYIQCVKNGIEPKDGKHYIFEVTLMAVYGTDIFDYVNTHVK
jgi:hypothetical protein